ncbi:hypothetical protein HHK36_008406 [Tetracentron sinense]|uniref:Red chlorophyll catabolite reductase n=1 Tax=Tetracentron sinense TaxID=13715 RepID=A0A834ZIE0_TETSI|nr:hypothetical protein HHK36_008406 [Tetracentron sinense]
MVVLIHHYLHLPFSSPSLSLSYHSSSKRPRVRISASSSSSPMDRQNRRRGGYVDFPHLSAQHRELMLDLVSTVETRLESDLLPSSLSPDVQYFENESGNSQAALHIRSGDKASPIDLVLGSWIHCELPSGALDITTISAYLKSSTDAPRFLIEFLQSSPTSLILILDLPPRKDLVLHQDYLDTFYGDTQLDKRRQELAKVPEVRPYFSSSLYIRCVCSPTAILVSINCEAGGEGRMEEIIRDHVGPVAKEVLGIWLDRCACGGRVVEVHERADLEMRDRLIKKKTIEIDLGSSLPRLFGPDVAGRVLEAIRDAFNT